MLRKLLIASHFSLMSTQVFAVEYMHCYTGAAPADAPTTNISPPPMDPFYAAFDVTVVRFACGHDISADLTMLDALREAGQCSAESEIAQFIAQTWESPVSVYRSGLAGKLGGRDAMDAYCASLEVCGDGMEKSYSEACFAAYSAINQ